MKFLKKYFSKKTEIEFSLFTSILSIKRIIKLKKLCLYFYAKLHNVVISDFEYIEEISEN